MWFLGCRNTFVAKALVVVVVAHPPDPRASADPPPKTQWRDKRGRVSTDFATTSFVCSCWIHLLKALVLRSPRLWSTAVLLQLIVIAITFCCHNVERKISLWQWNILKNSNFFYFVTTLSWLRYVLYFWMYLLCNVRVSAAVFIEIEVGRLQEPKADKDEENCRKLNEYLNNPPAPGSARSASGGVGSLPSELSSLGGLCVLFFFI